MFKKNIKLKQQTEETVKLLGQKLGFLLARSKMPGEVKLAWLSLLPEMSFEQIDRLTQILEDQIKIKANEEFEVTIKELTEIKKELDAKRDKINKTTIEKLSNIEKKLLQAKT